MQSARDLDQLAALRSRLAEACPSLYALLTSHDAAVAFHLDGVVLASNAAADDLAGADSLVGHGVGELVHADDEAQVVEHLRRLEAGDTSFVRRVFRPRNAALGASVTVETALLPAVLDGRRVLVTLATGVVPPLPRDAASLEALFARSTHPVLVVDERGVVTRANAPASELLGYPLDELKGLELERLMPREHRARHVALRLAFTAHPDVRPIEARPTFFALTRDGTTVPVEIGLSPLVLDGARSTVAVLRSLVPRALAAQALRESEARFRGVFEAASDGIFLADAEGRYVDVNPAGCAMLRGQRADLLGRQLTDFIVPEDLARMPLRLGEVRAGASPTVERLMRRLDGTSLPVEISTAALPGGLVQGIVRDLTPRRRAEEAQREASKLEAVGRLAGGVAHDFNNILTVVLSLAEELRGRLAGQADALELVAEVRGAGQRAAELTGQLLAFARRQPVQARVVDVTAEVRRLSRFLERSLGEDVALLLELEEGLPGVRMDPSQLEQCVVNLAVNGRDAMPGGGTLVLRTTARDEGVCIEVADSGVGMSPETLQHIFEPFFTTKPVGRGTGLGLSTVHGIVTAAGGRLGVDSLPGQGTTFVLWLPASEDPVAIPTSLTPVPSAEGGSECILLVEDDHSVRVAVQRALTAAGYTVHACAGLEQALPVAEGESPLDLLLTDVVMPRADGLQVAEAVRALRPGLPVLFMSGYAPEIERLSALGRVVTKPFTPEALSGAVRAALQRRSGG